MNKFNNLAFLPVGFLNKTGMILLSLLFALAFLSKDVNAQETISKSYKVESYQDDWQTSKQIKENFEKFVIPISNSLSYSLTKSLPEVDGRPFPLGISIRPTDPDGFVQIVYHCSFGREICEPFFQACAALYLQCAE